MMQSPEFITAEIAYRAERISAELRSVRRRRKIRSYLHLRPTVGHTEASVSESRACVTS